MSTQPGNRKNVPIAVRDLDWIISAPFLLARTPLPNLSDLPETKALLHDLYKDPEPLLAHLENLNRHTLGSYFEHLVIFWLDHLPSVSVLATNLQVFDGKTTIGEIDLLFTYENKTYHWELAIKFYLNIGSGAYASDFVGPKRQDNLDRKLARLYDHQLNLTNRKEAKSILRKLATGGIHSYAWVKGVLFQPGSLSSDLPASLPDQVSRNCPIGRWIRLSEIEKSPFPDFEFFLFPQKPHWLASHFYMDEARAGGKKALEKTANQNLDERSTPLLTYLLSQGDTPQLEVSERLFIVPDHWTR